MYMFMHVTWLRILILGVGFYRGMHDILDYEGDDLEDVFCLSFEVSHM